MLRSMVKIKTCVGPVLYNSAGELFLMTSPKWGSNYVIPGGAIEAGESEEDALRREIREELGIEIADIVKLSESVKKASKDFIDPEVEFHFKTFAAKAMSVKITPNEEIKDYGWFSLADALELALLDSTRDAILVYKERFGL